MIRKLLAKDVALATKLYKQLYPEFNKDEIDLTTSSFSAVYLPLVYEEAGKVVGLIIGIIFAYGDTKEGYIEQLVVDEPHRKTGIGRLLTQQLLDVFQEKGAQAIWVATDFNKPEDDPTGFYAKLGFKKANSPWMVKTISKQD